MHGYRLTRAADDDLGAIFDAGAAMFGAAHADANLAGPQSALSFLADTPFAARLRRETGPPVRAWRYKAHLILYIVNADGVLVVRVRHGREDWMRDGQP